MSNLNNKKVKSDIIKLKKMRKKFISDTLSIEDLKKKLDLSNDEIFKVKPTIRYGLTRYGKKKVLNFIKKRK